MLTTFPNLDKDKTNKRMKISNCALAAFVFAVHATADLVGAQGVNIVEIGKSRGLAGAPDGIQSELVELGVEFKDGVTVTMQSAPGKFDTTIADEDGTTISFTDADPINVFSLLHFDKSEDGSYVTEKVTGKRIDLKVFAGSDKGSEVFVSKGEDGELLEMEITDPNGNIKHFHIMGGSVYGYSDEDIDVEAMQAKFQYGEPPEVEDDDTPETSGGGRSLHVKKAPRKLQACNGNFKYVDVAIAYDTDFCNNLGGSSAADAKVQAIVSRASEITRKTCVSKS